MASDITFRGEINEMSAAYFVREIESLAPRSSATIYLHTPGGDVYAGGEMVNALRAACTKRGCKVSLELGSLCASMGAVMLAAARSCGCKVSAHSNSEVMFHGCWSIIVGGADELTDQAKAMRDFNECVRKDLKKCGIEDTEEWFAADRQKWLNADELLALGLVDEILEAASADPESMKDDAVKIAALLNHAKEKKMEEIKAEEVKPEEAAPVAEAVETPAEAAPVAVEEAKPEEHAPEAPAEEEAPKAEEPADDPNAVAEADIEERVTALANKRFAGLQAKHEKMMCDLVKERDAARKELADAKAEATILKADIEKLTADLAASRDQLTTSEQNRANIVVDALAPSAELPTMMDGLAACKTLAERAAFLNAGNFKH